MSIGSLILIVGILVLPRMTRVSRDGILFTDFFRLNDSGWTSDASLANLFDIRILMLLLKMHDKGKQSQSLQTEQGRMLRVRSGAPAGPKL